MPLGSTKTGLLATAGANVTIPLELTGTNENYDVATALGNPVDPVNVEITIQPGAIVGATSTANSALDLSGLAAGSKVTVINNGDIIGKGGAGGNGGIVVSTGTGATIYCEDNNTYADATAGGNGGDAISCPAGIELEIDNTNGNIFAGGGGGGGGGLGGFGDAGSYCSHYTGQGGGGGAGYGSSNGGVRGGFSGPLGANGCNTANATNRFRVVCYGANGVAGNGATPGAARAQTGWNYSRGSGGWQLRTLAGASGAGGGYGDAGGAGGQGSTGYQGDASFNCLPVRQVGQAGGAGGNAVQLNGSTINWLAGNNATQVKGAVA